MPLPKVIHDTLDEADHPQVPLSVTVTLNDPPPAGMLFEVGDTDQVHVE